eukprot:2414803-Rhodomonas_salina.1
MSVWRSSARWTIPRSARRRRSVGSTTSCTPCPAINLFSATTGASRFRRHTSRPGLTLHASGFTVYGFVAAIACSALATSSLFLDGDAML